MIFPHAQVLANGLAVGSLYVMAALGMKLVADCTGRVHMAVGHVLVLTAMGTAHLTGELGLPLIPVIAGLGLATACMAYVAHPKSFWSRFLADGKERSFLLLTLGAALVLEALAQCVWPLADTAFVRTGTPVSLGEISVTMPKALALGVSTAACVCLWAFLRWCRLGKALRAWESSLGEIRIVGVDPNGLGRWVATLGLGIMGLSGALVGASQVVSAQDGMAWCLKSLCIAIMGGTMRPLNTLLLGWGLGVGEAWVSQAVGPGWHPVLVPVLLPVLLQFRSGRKP